MEQNKIDERCLWTIHQGEAVLWKCELHVSKGTNGHFRTFVIVDIVYSWFYVVGGVFVSVYTAYINVM